MKAEMKADMEKNQAKMMDVLAKIHEKQK